MFLDLRIQNNTVAASHDLLTQLKPSCQVVTDAALGVTSVTVDNTSGFESGQVLLVGNFGDPTAEIIYTSAGTAPTNTVITFATATTKDHASGTPVTVIDFDEVEFYTSTTVDGAKTLLARVPIMADRPDTPLTLDPEITGYISFRFIRRSRYLVEDGTGYYIVELGSGFYLTETQ